MLLVWVLTLIIVTLTVGTGLLLYIPGLILSKLTAHQRFEYPGVYLIRAGVLLFLATAAAHEDRKLNEKGDLS